jgi:hypothetical protein
LIYIKSQVELDMTIITTVLALHQRIGRRSAVELGDIKRLLATSSA